MFRYLKLASAVMVPVTLLAGCSAPPVPAEVEAEAAKPVVVPSAGGPANAAPAKRQKLPLPATLQKQLPGAKIQVWRLPSGRILLAGSVPRAGQIKVAGDGVESFYKTTVINQVAVEVARPPAGKPIKVRMVEEARQGKLYHNTGWPIAVSPNGKVIATVGQNVDSVILYEVASRKARVLQVDNVHDYYNVRMSTRSLVFAPDSKTIYMGGVGWSDSPESIGTLNQWDVATGKHLKTFAKNGTRGPVVLFSPDKKVLAAVGDENTIRFWNPRSGKEAGRLTTPIRPSAMAYSPDGRYMAIISANDIDRKTRKWYVFRVWDLRTKKIAWQAEPPVERFLPITVAWSPDGKQIAVGAMQGEAAVWNASSHRLQYKLKYQPPADNPYAQPKSNSWEVQFSPDGKLLATGGYQGVSLWNARTGKLVRYYKNGANGLAFMPDGSKLLMSNDKRYMVMEKL